MPDYLYIFGFEAPDEARRNDRFGWDDEDSDGVVIEADDEAAALAWGHQISEPFLELLYRDSGMSWRDRGYLGWIERNPNRKADRWEHQQHVHVGAFPDFTPWLQLHGNAMRPNEAAEARHNPPMHRTGPPV
jgi:hypothetical protein